MDQTIKNLEDNSNGYDLLISNNEKSPLDSIIEQETADQIKLNIDTLLSSNLISDKQKEQIRMYYFEGFTLSKIGKHFGVSREAIRQSIKRAIDLFKSHDKSYT